MNVIYARQSIDKKDSLSVEGQVELCRRYAGEDAQVFEDRGYSGKNTKRPAFIELMKAVDDGTVEKIYVYRLDRFSRSIADFSRLWEILERCGVAFQSVTEQFDTSSPMGRAMLHIVLVFAQLERETTAERVKDNYMHRFHLGAWPGGPAPYGYTLTKLCRGGSSISSLTANENAAVVRKIFAQYADTSSSLRSVAGALTAEGIPGPRREAWDSVTLSRILHSPLYVRADADIYWYYLAKGLQIQQEPEAFDSLHACNIIGRRDRSRNKYNAPEEAILTVANHEGIVDSALWLRAQDKLEKNFQLPRKNAGKYSWLTGLMKCGRCGYALKVNYSKKENICRLTCSGRSNFGTCDAAIGVTLTELEERAAFLINELLREGAADGELFPQSAETAEKVLEIEQKIERLVQALSESSEVSARYISSRIEQLHRQREDLLRREKQLPHKPTKLNFGTLDFEEKKLVAAEFIEKILIYGDHVRIIWKV